MKLLLVDDEEFSREGLRHTVDWQALGICEVLCAEDGEQGLAAARAHRPDIVLTDVRMPRLNGVDMAFAIRALIPNCSIIFMSGFSDKEYLKSAIQLSAVNYIEKPLDAQEMIATLTRAVEQRSYRSAGDRLLKQEAVLSLARRPQDAAGQLRTVRAFYPQAQERASVVALAVQLYLPEEESAQAGERVRETLEQRLGLEPGFTVMTACAAPGRVAAWVQLSPSVYAQDPVQAGGEVNRRCYALAQVLASCGRFMMAVGGVEDALSGAWKSYETAQATLQRSFFYKPCSVLLPAGERNLCEFQFVDTLYEDFLHLLRHSDDGRMTQFFDELVRGVRFYDATPPAKVKAFFGALARLLYEEAQQERNALFPEQETPAQIQNAIQQMQFLCDIEQYLTEKLRLFAQLAETGTPDSRVVRQVRLHIHEHFDNPALSVSGIAKQFYLSASYLCVLFRRETGSTVNGYLLEYRLQKAKELLKDENRRVKDVARQVGFADANYFNKVFKRSEGKTPQEYREVLP